MRSRLLASTLTTKSLAFFAVSWPPFFVLVGHYPYLVPPVVHRSNSYAHFILIFRLYTRRGQLPRTRAFLLTFFRCS
ncbi:hypothetical protein C8J57DRAFT_1310514 [Mycena rebaudengoi]|nr:hypothetical protein C8J57DRAFT_1310514 [Mycena rebaudengoi]